MKGFVGISFFLALGSSAQAADIEAGKQLASTVCAACHGANGVSVNDAVPNLAAQRAGYIETQLKAFKEGTRKIPGAVNPTLIMNAIAAQLSTEDIASVAAYFASLPGAAAGAKSAALPNVARTRVTFPETYKEAFTKYHTINFPPAKQVRYYYANSAAFAAAQSAKTLPDGSSIFVEVYDARLDAQNNPIKGSDGFFVPDKLTRYVAMARDAGWGEDIPELLRNENWNYAIFKTDKQYQPINQAECLACHKPLSNVSYLFTLQQLAAEK
jgi:cytochrome c553